MVGLGRLAEYPVEVDGVGQVEYPVEVEGIGLVVWLGLGTRVMVRPWGRAYCCGRGTVWVSLEPASVSAYNW